MCVMYESGQFRPWDTSLVNNAKRFQGIIFDQDSDGLWLANRGAFKTELPNGTYYCNSTGDLVTSLPVGSFVHELGEVSGGYLHINEDIVASVGAINWGDIGGDINNQTDLILLLDQIKFTNCC